MSEPRRQFKPPAVGDRPNSVPWPPLILVAAIAAGYVLTVFLPLPWPPSPLSDMLFAAGLLLIAAALAMDIAAMRTMHRAKTTILPHRASDHLVTAGPFGFSRNPIYVANVMIVSGIGLVAGWPWFFVAALLVGLLINVLAIPGEERHLEHRFGKAYRDYKKSVRRWL
jgi:protein-S-isoprenylcysteine O-methyltransferase Ste14